MGRHLAIHDDDGDIRCDWDLNVCCYNVICPICNGAEDSWRHALIDCNMAKCVWSLMDEELVEHLIACRITDARLWLLQIKDSMREDEFVRISVTLW